MTDTWRGLAVDVAPVTLAEAKQAVESWHSHHAPHVGQRWAIGAFADGTLCAVCVMSRAVAPGLDTRQLWEVTRLAVGPGAPHCTASRLLGAASRAALCMGVRRLVSYTRVDERGTCYKAAGWHPVARVKGRHHDSGNRRCRWLPGMHVPSTEVIDRVRWERGPDADPADWSITLEER